MGVATLKFSPRSARTLLKRTPPLKFLDLPLNYVMYLTVFCLTYISGLCTAAVELHKDNAFALNSEILQFA